MEYSFAYGRTDIAYLRGTLPIELDLHLLDTNESTWQHSTGNFQKIGQSGNWKRVTNGDITDRAGIMRLLSSFPQAQSWLG